MPLPARSPAAGRPGAGIPLRHRRRCCRRTLNADRTSRACCSNSWTAPERASLQRRTVLRQFQRRDRMLVLLREVQGAAGRRDHSRLRRSRQQFTDDRVGLAQLLEIVQDQQCLTIGELREQSRQGPGLRWQAQRLGDRGPHQLGRGRRGQRERRTRRRRSRPPRGERPRSPTGSSPFRRDRSASAT